jgi:hypothetical protein
MNVEPVVSFGKYRDKPLSDLLADCAYVEHLRSQRWVSDNYRVYSSIMGVSGDPTSKDKTPRHNAVQARFLDDGFVFENVLKLDFPAPPPRTVFEDVVRFANEQSGLHVTTSQGEGWELADSHIFHIYYVLKPEYRVVQREFEAPNGADVFLEIEVTPPGLYVWFDHKRMVPRTRDSHEVEALLRAEFADRHVLVLAGESGTRVRRWMFIEIKPSLGDDYPSVLRQMKRQQETTNRMVTNETPGVVYVLYTESFASDGVTLSQVRKIFSLDNIMVVVNGSRQSTTPNGPCHPNATRCPANGHLPQVPTRVDPSLGVLQITGKGSCGSGQQMAGASNNIKQNQRKHA